MASYSTGSRGFKESRARSVLPRVGNSSAPRRSAWYCGLCVLMQPCRIEQSLEGKEVKGSDPTFGFKSIRDVEEITPVHGGSGGGGNGGSGGRCMGG